MLHDAAAMGDATMVRVLIEVGSAVNAKDDWGNTPLHLACKYGHYEAAEQLLEAFAPLHDINEVSIGSYFHKSIYSYRTGFRVVPELWRFMI